MPTIRIAIDGPGGAGKSTMAKLLASKLGIEYIDTGAMYRAIALKLIEKEVPPEDIFRVDEVLAVTDIDFINGRVYLDGKDVSDRIRTQEVSMAASTWSRLRAVREKLVALQRVIASGKSVVMDGRDIGTNVLPNAEVKFFLTADPLVRAKRRYDELVSAGKEADLEQIHREMIDRDYQDTHRELNPLRQAENAILIDSSYLTIEEVVETMLNEIGKKGLGA